MDINQQYRLLPQQAGASGFHYNAQNGAGLRQQIIDPMQEFACLNRDYSEEDGMFDGPQGLRAAPRRTKRTIPDGEKDDRYWEKRKRNNEAAKRSRENKRRLDFEIRSRLNFLEEENALLRRELEILKTKLCIPVDQSVLSAEDRAEVLATVEKSLSTKIPNGSDDSMEILPTSIMVPGSMDLAKIRSVPIPVKRESDDLTPYFSYTMNAPFVWQEQQQQPMTSFSPPDVIRRGQFEAKTFNSKHALQSPTFLRGQARMSPYDMYSIAQYQQNHTSPQLDRLSQSPTEISSVQNLNSSFSGSQMPASPDNLLQMQQHINDRIHLQHQKLHLPHCHQSDHDDSHEIRMKLSLLADEVNEFVELENQIE